MMHFILNFLRLVWYIQEEKPNALLYITANSLVSGMKIRWDLTSLLDCSGNREGGIFPVPETHGLFSGPKTYSWPSRMEFSGLTMCAKCKLSREQIQPLIYEGKKVFYMSSVTWKSSSMGHHQQTYQLILILCHVSLDHDIIKLGKTL